MADALKRELHHRDFSRQRTNEKARISGPCVGVGPVNEFLAQMQISDRFDDGTHDAVHVDMTLLDGLNQ